MQTTISSESRQGEARPGQQVGQQTGQQVWKEQNVSDTIGRALGHAYEAQRSFTESACDLTVDQMQPLLRESFDYVQRLQAAFFNYCVETGNIVYEQSQRALVRVNEAVRAGSDGARQTVEQVQRSVEKGTERPAAAQAGAQAQRGRETVSAGVHGPEEKKN